MSWKLQNLNTKQFVQDYWQKKPCLIRQAFSDFKSPLTPEELAGLACEDEVHSRLVVEKNGSGPWQLSYGPFDEKSFNGLPETHYSLLVSECEKWIPELTDLLNQFRFIPAWRIDDLMISYAPRDGSVGPHSDEYDVFLLQAQGQRRWQYTDKRVVDPPLIPDLELSIMRDFSYDQEAVLGPGDMLYLPPGIAHHGVAIDACMTFSIGFRAPSASELLESILLEIDQQKLGTQRYTDPGWDPGRHASEISDTEVAQFKSLALSLFDQPENLWRDAIGKLLSDTTSVEQDSINSTTDFDEIIKHDWIINPDCKMLYYRGSSKLKFYYSGQVSDLPNTEPVLKFVQELCECRSLSFEMVNTCMHNKSIAQLICELIANSALVVAEE